MEWYSFGCQNVILEKDTEQHVTVSTELFGDPSYGILKFLVKHTKENFQLILGAEGDVADLHSNLETGLSSCSKLAPLDDFMQGKSGLVIGEPIIDVTDWKLDPKKVVFENPKNDSYDFVVCHDEKEIWKTPLYLRSKGYCILILKDDIAQICRYSRFFKLVLVQRYQDSYHIVVLQKRHTGPLLRVYWQQPPSGSFWSRQIFRHIPHVNVNDIQDCDVIVHSDLTTNFQHVNQGIWHNALNESAEAKKPMVMFVHDDPEDAMPVVSENNNAKNVLLFRTSFLHSLREPHEHLLPSFQAEEHKLSALQPVSNMKIGYCGCISNATRKQCCAILQKDKSLQTHFILQDKFHGHCTVQEQILHRQQFVQVMSECAYQLCCRGAGNFSHRFYETLAYGRIPVLVNTDMCLPENVPSELWSNCIVFAPSVEALPQLLHDFHFTHDVNEVQLNCRKLWETYLTFETFASFVHTQINRLLR